MSASRFLLDTNICIYIRQNRHSSVIERFRVLSPGDAAISVITYGELAGGAEKSQRREIALSGLQNLLRFLSVLPLPEDAGRAYGFIRSALERHGNSTSSNDLWIAAHALAAHMILVTNNEDEFRRVPELAIESWAAAP